MRRATAVVLALCVGLMASRGDAAENQALIAAGRYAVITGHCNNCHTADYQRREGDVPESRWLMGRDVGHVGAWGATYPGNLRRIVRSMGEQEWVRYAQTLKTRGGMPWWSLHETSAAELQAMYHFIHSLGPTGPEAPAYAPPGSQPHTPLIVIVTAATVGVTTPPAPVPPADIDLPAAAWTPDQAAIARGRHLIVTGHCNNCHTDDYGKTEGRLPDQYWLRGSVLGNRGRWGTTYASNLRITANLLSEEDWANYVHTAKMRPPMPWWALHETRIADLRAMYQFIRSLGVVGAPARDFVPADQAPPLPYTVWPDIFASWANP